MKIRILFLLLFGVNVTAGAQTQILYQSDQNKSYLLTYANSSDESQKVINEILQDIAKSIPKPVYQTKITMNIDESVKITRDKNLVSIYVDYQKIKMEGDVFYKGFMMHDALAPSKYEFTGVLSRKNGAKIALFSQPKTDLDPKFNEVILKYVDTVPNTNYTFAVNTLQFTYDHEARKNFHERASLVDQYYNADMDLGNINGQLSTINPNGIDDMDKSQTMMNSMKSSLDNISSAAFWQVLHIENHDPEKLSVKLYDVKKSFADVQNQLSYTQSIIHQLYFERGLGLYNNKKPLEAKAAFEKSLFYNPYYAPSQYYLAEIAFESNYIDEAKQQIKKFFTLKNIDNNTLSAAKYLTNALEWTDMNVASDLLNQGKYAEALTALGKAENFCQSLSYSMCNDTIELIKRDCYQGIYSNMVKTGENLLTQKQYDDANNQIDNALSYQKKYSKYISDNQDALDVKQKIQIEAYYAAMKRGKDDMAAKDYRSAFAEFDKAKTLENQYPVNKDLKLPELLKKSKTEVLMMDLDDASSAVAANNLPQARNIMKQVTDDQRSYNLYDNTKLTAKIDGLRKSIFSQECENAQKAYDAKISSASSDETNKNYLSSETKYKEALQVAGSNADCDINTNQATSGIQNVAKPAEYQRQLNQCNDLAKSFSYDKAISAYNILTDYFNNNNIGSYGFSHQPLYLYIATFESGFVLNGVSWFTNAGNLDNAMFLMKLLRQRNVPKATTKLQQMSLARAYAIEDFKTDNATDPKLKVSEYTLGDKWYGYFSSEYLKQIKRMK